MLDGELWSDALSRFLSSVATAPRSCNGPISPPRHLNLSNRGLSQLPGIEGLADHVRSIDLTFNRFKRLPPGLAALRKLESLDASRNCLLPTPEALLLSPSPAALRSFPALRLLDLRFNAKCGSPALQQRLAAEFAARGRPASAPALRLTLWGQFVGLAPSSRDATLLRSQLEPWPTSVLRKRLAELLAFKLPVAGGRPGLPVADTELADMERGAVMESLLAAYARALAASGGTRRELRVDGTPVEARLREPLLAELRRWREEQGARGRLGRDNRRRERPSVSAQGYMILRRPTAGELAAASNNSALGSRSSSLRASQKAGRALEKLQRHRRLWELAGACLRSVDASFCAAFSALAITYNFEGSPHIDKQNLGPFYGLALGEFPEGQGGVCVEVSAMEVGVVNTRNRLGKVDGRFPHWVAPYDAGAERFSLIFYRTEGDQYVVPDAAVFPEQA